jgi:hypothetical protein
MVRPQRSHFHFMELCRFWAIPGAISKSRPVLLQHVRGRKRRFHVAVDEVEREEEIPIFDAR